MNIENIGTVTTSVISGAVVGILIGYAVKKIIKIGIVILGCFFGAVAYLQTQGILNVNWDKVEGVSKNALTALNDAAISGHAADSIVSNLGLPLTGSMAMGFAIGFMKA